MVTDSVAFIAISLPFHEWKYLIHGHAYDDIGNGCFTADTQIAYPCPYQIFDELFHVL